MGVVAYDRLLFNKDEQLQGICQQLSFRNNAVVMKFGQWIT